MMEWVERPIDRSRIHDALRRSPVVLLVGPRQVGKSSLVKRLIADQPAVVFDLEDPRDLAQLFEPTLALDRRDELVVVDEAQLRPDLFPIMRVLVDEHRTPGRFLVLGSASPSLVGMSAESLAGRVTVIELGGLGVLELGSATLERRWLRGGFPPSVLARSEADSVAWRDGFIQTFLRRDLADLGFSLPAQTMFRFWSMIAHFHGQTWNGAEVARSIDVSEPTVRRYLDALSGALVVRQMAPWFANTGKRQVKSPRVFVRDSGLLHRLLGIADMDALRRHPRLGASWEGLVVEHLASRPDAQDATFWSTHAGAEIDLRLEVGGQVIGIEVKHTASPKVTKSMISAVETLGLDELLVVYRGEREFRLGDGIRAVPATTVLTASKVDTLRRGNHRR